MYVKFYYRDASGEVKEAAYDDLVHLLLYGKITELIREGVYTSPLNVPGK